MKQLRVACDGSDVNERGGKQAKIEFTLDGVKRALREIARVLYQRRAMHGKYNWKLIDDEDLLAHAICHVFEYINGDREEDHLVIAVFRILFAKELSMEDVGERVTKVLDDLLMQIKDGEECAREAFAEVEK